MRTVKYSQHCTYEAIEALFVVIANESPVFVVAPSSLLLKGGLRAFCRLIRTRSAWVLCENNDDDDDDDDNDDDDLDNDADDDNTLKCDPMGSLSLKIGARHFFQCEDYELIFPKRNGPQ